MDKPEFHFLGDSAILATFSRTISEEINDLVLWVSATLEGMCLPGVSEVQPAYSSLCVHFDPSQIRGSYLVDLIERIAEKAKPPEDQTGRPGQVVEIQVVYGGENGPDLDWACNHLGIPREELIRRHSERLYRVFMVGFTPGFPYLGGMDETIALPRLPEPRKLVPAGSVGIAGKQTGIYPWDSPGGWRIIGRTSAELFSPYRDPPSLLKPGDYVRFVPVSGNEWFPAHGNAERTGLLPDKDTPGRHLPRGPELTGSLRTEASVLGRLTGTELPGLAIEDPGFLSLVVDRGRFGYRKYGVPVAGATDSRSFALANLLCQNDPGDAAIEFTLKGPSMVALTDLTVAITGAPCEVTVDGRPVPQNAPVFLRKGSKLQVGTVRAACRGYIAVSGGIRVPVVLGSRSTYLRGKFGGFEGRHLKSGDTLCVGPAPEHVYVTRSNRATPVPQHLFIERLTLGETILRVLPGPEATPKSLEILSKATYTVRPDSDRMGLRLEGPAVFDAGATDILSSPVVPGTIQVASDGRPMLLLADGQTTGGYARIATVISRDLPLAGQVRAGAKIRFKVLNPWQR
ncbi:MAG: 5-oxoprolinase subunit PxpB [Candidatus Fermentithermobacillus carboniphilus]|uniref:5-oxoprolinase subunit PxpB n=1 Tax=Candidatus Fermentithermobacillus carboniphilus TaxID=3085328 RepID=A0AAT9LCM2_9FIRM|nr:MAG: 5-oxoprolinase subunit PxpB [Candidatus Fermentithermobacillus carboniphilus]